MFGTTFDSFQYTLWYLIPAAIKIAQLFYYLTKFPALLQALWAYRIRQCCWRMPDYDQSTNHLTGTDGGVRRW